MGCNTCKQNNESSSGDSITNSIPNNLNSENIFIRVIAFCSVMISLPLIFLVLLGQIFIAFFLPKQYDKISKKFSDVYIKVINKSTSKKMEKENLKRQKQFKGKGDYSEDSKLLDIEVYDENNEIKKEG